MQQPKSYAAAWNGKTFALVATGIGARAQHQSQIHRRVFDPEIEGSDLQVNFNMQQPKLYIITWNGKAFCRKLLFDSPACLALKRIIRISNRKLTLAKKTKSKDLRKLVLISSIKQKAKNILSNNQYLRIVL